MGNITLRSGSATTAVDLSKALMIVTESMRHARTTLVRSRSPHPPSTQEALAADGIMPASTAHPLRGFGTRSRSQSRLR